MAMIEYPPLTKIRLRLKNSGEFLYGRIADEEEERTYWITRSKPYGYVTIKWNNGTISWVQPEQDDVDIYVLSSRS